MVVSGVPRATVVLLSKVAQGTIANRSAVLAGQQVLMVRPRARAPGMPCGVPNLTLWGCEHVYPAYGTY